MAAALDEQGVEEQEALKENRGKIHVYGHTHLCQVISKGVSYL